MNNLIPDGHEYAIHHGDTIPHMFQGMPESSCDMMLTSVPFSSMFSYTDESCDLGNVEDLQHEMKIHFSYFFRGLRRVMKPGRIALVHCMQIPGLARNGRPETTDFRGILIRLARRSGFLYDYEWVISKNPQSQAIRTHSHGLLFVTLKRDRAKTRGAMPDFVLKFITPGDNEVPIDSPGITQNDWIKWAEVNWSWHEIKETDTLNTKAAKSGNDTRHICPLQLGVISRLVKMFSNPGEIVFDPFTGIGSTGYEALKLDRRFYGCELKDEYHVEALKNMERAIRKRADSQTTLFDRLETAGEADAVTDDHSVDWYDEQGSDDEPEATPEPVVAVPRLRHKI
jgi:DNA methylase